MVFRYFFLVNIWSNDSEKMGVNCAYSFSDRKTFSNILTKGERNGTYDCSIKKGNLDIGKPIESRAHT